MASQATPSLLPQLLSLLEARQRWGFVLVALSILAFSTIEVIGVGAVFWFVSLLNDPSPIETNSWLVWLHARTGGGTAAEFLFFLGLSALGVILLRNVIGALATWQRIQFVRYTEYWICQKLLLAYVTRPYAFFLRQNTAELSKNLLVEVRQLTSGLVMPVLMIATDVSVTASILAFLLWHDFMVTSLVFAITGGMIGGGYALVRRSLGHLGERQRQANAAAFRTAGDALQGIKMAKAYGKEPYFREHYRIAAQSLARIAVASQLFNQMPRFIIETIAFSGLIGIALYVLAVSGTGSDVIGALALYGAAGFRLMPSLHRITGSFGQIRYSRPILTAVAADIRALDAAPAPEAHPDALPFSGGLRFENVGFRYSEDERPVVRDVSFALARNRSMALVGPTGAGKTTLVDLAMGLLQPTEGRILVDGVALSPALAPAWRRNVGYVPQDTFLLDRSVAENIAFGVDEADIDMTAVAHAARLANLHEFVTSELPDGYSTAIGERGVRLSGGQRQRIGIARALYRRPKLLIMDEATSSLDGITEGVIREAIDQLGSELTMIVIAHRINTVRNCDVIYLVDGGAIVDAGTYTELMGNNQMFRAMAGGGAE